MHLNRSIDSDQNREANSEKYALDIDIIDTGIGIEKERQQYLFIPFLELKAKQNLRKVKDNSIGMGLACASCILNKLKGKVTLK